jgi:spore germination cell wall hydrolase CwlJ-like protein
MRKLSEPRGPAWDNARRVAEAVYWQRHTPTLAGARFYHAIYVTPNWAKERQRIGRIGQHIFYR